MAYPVLIQQPPPSDPHPHRDSGIVLLVLGILGIIGGGFAASYCSASLIGICIDYPYAGVGDLAVLLGIVLLIVGIILIVLKGPASPPTVVYSSVAPPSWPPTPPQPPQTPGNVPARYCPSCGASNSLVARFCSRCGKPLPPPP